jgi:acetyl/propionyl-CoA carboxylase alpha subunit
LFNCSYKVKGGTGSQKFRGGADWVTSIPGKHGSHYPTSAVEKDYAKSGYPIEVKQSFGQGRSF